MIDILVYLLDQQYEEEIAATLVGVNYLYHKASTLDELINICTQNDIDFILVWPAKVEIVEDLITLLQSKNFGYIPVVPVINRQENILPIMKIPVVEVIQFPLPKLEFLSILNRLVEELQFSNDLNNGQHWYGQLKELSVGELIKLVAVSRRDAVLNISLREHRGQIVFHRGKIIRVTLRNLSGVKSFQKMIYLKRGNFHLNFTGVDLPEEIEVDNQLLFSQLNNQSKNNIIYYKSLQKSEDDLVTAEIPPPDLHDQVKNIILDHCRRGTNIDELLVSLEEDNAVLLTKIQELFQDKLLVLRSESNAAIKPEAEKKNLGKFFKKISNLFKKEEKQVFSPKLIRNEPKKEKEIIPRLLYQMPPLSPEDKQKINKYFEGD